MEIKNEELKKEIDIFIKNNPGKELPLELREKIAKDLRVGMNLLK